MASEHAGLLYDTNFYVALATVAFAILAYKKGRGPILKFLDDRTERIRHELDEAERLRIEAQDLLADMQKKHRDAVQTADKIIDNAKKSAERLQKETEEALTESMKRREAQLTERIQRAETAAIQELQDKAADIATKSAHILLHDVLAKKDGKLVEDAIKDLPKRLAS